MVDDENRSAGGFGDENCGKRLFRRIENELTLCEYATRTFSHPQQISIVFRIQSRMQKIAPQVLRHKQQVPQKAARIRTLWKVFCLSVIFSV